MIENGCLIVVEKSWAEDSLFNRLFIKNYYEFKSATATAKWKLRATRSAGERADPQAAGNRELLLRSGFRYCDAFFKWYNFSGLIAVK
jgi:tRNA (cmo5U34)-methyltransferase